MVEDALAKGYLGTEAIYPVDGFPSHGVANLARLSVKRAGEHLGVSAAPWVVDGDGLHCPGPCKDPNGPHGVRFRLYTKESARRHVLAATGGDPAKLRYNPFAKAQTPVVDERGHSL